MAHASRFAWFTSTGHQVYSSIREPTYGHWPSSMTAGPNFMDCLAAATEGNAAEEHVTWEKLGRAKAKRYKTERSFDTLNIDGSDVLKTVAPGGGGGGGSGAPSEVAVTAASATVDRRQLLRDAIELDDLRLKKRREYRQLTFAQQRPGAAAAAAAVAPEPAVAGATRFNLSGLDTPALPAAVGAVATLRALSRSLLGGSSAPRLDHSAAGMVVEMEYALNGLLRIYWSCFSAFDKLVDVKLASEPGASENSKRATKMANALKTTVLAEMLPGLRTRLGADADLTDNLVARVNHAVHHHDIEWQTKRSKKLAFLAKQKRK